MIGKLVGVIDSIEENHLILDVNGVGYLIFCPAYILASKQEGDKASFHIQTIVREDDIILYGFNNQIDKKLFNLLISVQGIGSKIAIAMISNITGEDLQKAIAFEDIDTLKSIPGIGAKVAQRICNELKDKITNIFNITVEASSLSLSEVKNKDIDEAKIALQVLGYSNAEIKNVLTKIDQKIINNAKAEDIIKESLKFFVKNIG